MQLAPITRKAKLVRLPVEGGAKKRCSTTRLTAIMVTPAKKLPGREHQDIARSRSGPHLLKAKHVDQGQPANRH